jgi:5,5'-dehydrodivanillate O-demethylase
MEAVAAGRDPKGVIRNPNVAAFIELPNMTREINTEGLTLEEFAKYPVLHQRLAGFRHHYGQPPEVHRAFLEAMGVGSVVG